MRRSAVAASVLLLFSTVAAPAAADDTGLGHYGSIDQPNLQQNWDRDEAGLGASTAAQPDFGRLWSTTVDGTTSSTPNQLYAQPLVYKGKVYVATEENRVEILDEQTGKRIAARSLGTPWTPINCGDLAPHIGITSTPVIDPTTSTIYVITNMQVPGSKNSIIKMWGLSTNNLATRSGWPLDIKGVPTNSTLTFNPTQVGQRASLTMDAKHAVYFGTASHCSHGPYIGYVGRVSTSSGAAGSLRLWSTQKQSLNDQGGVWQAGGALMTDGNDANGNPRLFVATGNGLGPSASPGGSSGASRQKAFGQSVIRLGVSSSNGSLSPQDFFSPSNADALNGNDEDIGSGAPVALPDSFGTSKYPHMLTVAGKAGVAYLLNRDNLGGRSQGSGKSDAALSEADLGNGNWGRAAVFDGGTATTRFVYYQASHEPLQAFTTNPNGAGVPTLALAKSSSEKYNYGTSSPLVTSDGNDPSSAMVWMTTSDGNAGTHGYLVGYPAVPPTTGAWKPLVKFSIGTQNKFANIASSDNRLFVGTKDGRVLAYGSPSGGALTASATSFAPQPADGTTTTTKNVTLTAAKPLKIGTPSVSSTTSGAKFELGSGAPSSQHLAANQSVQVPVDLTTSTAGANTGTLTVPVTPDDTGTATAYRFNVSGVGTKNGILAQPTSLSFGKQPATRAMQQAVTIQNTSTSPETISKVTPPAHGAFSFAGTPPKVGQTIQPQGSVTFTVRFDPASAVRYVGSFAVGATLQGQATPVYSAKIPLSGQGVHGAPKLQVSGSLFKNGIFEFSTVAPGTTSSGTMTITNVGNLPDHINKAAIPSEPFEVPQPFDEGVTLAPGESLSATITVRPTTGGPRSDYYSFTDSAGRINAPIRVNVFHQAGEVRGKFGCITDKDLSRSNGAPIVNAPCNGTRSQVLGLDSRGGMHWFAAYGDYCMDVRGAKTKPGTTIQFLTCNGSWAQQWTFSASGKLVNPHSKLCLAVRNSVTAPNTPLILASCASKSLGELWDPTQLIGKRGEFTSGFGANGQYCVTAPKYGAKLGTKVVVQTCKLQTYNGRDTAAGNANPTQVIAHAGTTLRASGGCLTQSHSAARSPVWIAPCVNAQSQQWVASAGSGVMNKYSHQCMNVYGGAPGATGKRNLVMYPCNRTKAQVLTLPDH